MDLVKAWEETVVIPTYPVGEKEKNPVFLEKRVYQGSSGVVYPHAVIEKIHDEKVDKYYRALFIENEYIRIMVLPELGGRIQMAYDKVKERHFIYYNSVIKPALVGLTGPWISGGIEFNWPQHHRPSTFEPVDATIIENADGSKSVLINEVERMFRTKCLARYTLYPGKAYIEIRGSLYNRTPLPQTFLWWANPAVKVNEHYRSVFPPDVHAVYDHGRRDVSDFPIATGVYYKVDYSPGTDISRYSNIPVPTSYMAVSSNYNFIGGYEDDTRAGLLHVADHHIAPGKKQWTWGHSDFGKAWDRNLTDEDGPYIELMTGMFTDNQPDFSWLQPYETKNFIQYFMPYSEVGTVCDASKEIIVGIDADRGRMSIRVYTTAPYAQVMITVEKGGEIIFSETTGCSPSEPFVRTVAINEMIESEKLSLAVTDLQRGKVLIRYRDEKTVDPSLPSPAVAALQPAEIKSTEELYLTGLHLEQYRHATYSPIDYYEEALRRDEGDARSNNALGRLLLRRGQFAKAELYFRKAIATLTARNGNPYDGEPYYNLGLSLELQGRYDEAFDAFYKAIWNDAWGHSGFLHLARIACRRGDYEEALALAEQSLAKNYNSHTARHLECILFRKLERLTEARAICEASLKTDPFNYGCIFELYLLDERVGDASSKWKEQLLQLSRGWEHNFIEYAIDYAHAGCYQEGIALLQLYLESTTEPYALASYFIGWMAAQMGDEAQAMQYFRDAALLDTKLVFPNRLEELIVLKAAIRTNPADAKAPYYLGSLWYDKRQYSEAISCWEASIGIDPNFPTVHRNLALAYYNKEKNGKKALASLQKAFELDQGDARVLMELDQLYKRMNEDVSQRLARLQQHLTLVTSRDDLYLERISLYNQLGDYGEARALLQNYRFHPWEGGEGKVVRQWIIAHTQLAREAIAEGMFSEALHLLQQLDLYPPNLGEGKLQGSPENELHYLKGIVYEALGDEGSAKQQYQQASFGVSEPVQAIFYNDPQPDQLLYRGLALQKLGEGFESAGIFNKLIRFGEAHINDCMRLDYFAVSLPDLLVFDVDLDERNRIHCLYMMALGHLGLGNEVEAERLFQQVLQMDINHLGALMHRRLLSKNTVV